jgi:hypothetical protein
MNDLHTNEDTTEGEEGQRKSNLLLIFLDVMNVGTDVRQDTDKIMELLRQWEMNEPEDQVIFLLFSHLVNESQTIFLLFSERYPNFFCSHFFLIFF